MINIVFDNDPTINQQLIDYANKIITIKGIDYAIEKAKKMIVDSENSKKSRLLNNSPLLNTEIHIDFSKKLLEYFQTIKIEIRNKKLISLLGENKHILNFEKFNLYK